MTPFYYLDIPNPNLKKCGEGVRGGCLELQGVRREKKVKNPCSLGTLGSNGSSVKRANLHLDQCKSFASNAIRGIRTEEANGSFTFKVGYGEARSKQRLFERGWS